MKILNRMMPLMLSPAARAAGGKASCASRRLSQALRAEAWLVHGPVRGEEVESGVLVRSAPEPQLRPNEAKRRRNPILNRRPDPVCGIDATAGFAIRECRAATAFTASRVTGRAPVWVRREVQTAAAVLA